MGSSLLRRREGIVFHRRICREAVALVSIQPPEYSEPDESRLLCCLHDSAATPQEGIMNSVQLVGRLATEIDLKEVTGGSKVSSFILAVDRNAEEADLLIVHTNREPMFCTANGRQCRH